MALEGSDRTDAGLANVRAYLDDLNDRSLTAITDGELSIEIAALFRLLSELADPAGSSAYCLKIEPRNLTGRPPNPRAKRIRGNDAAFAAIYADSLLEQNREMQKKEANSLAAERMGVAISEVHAGRKSALYRQLREWELHLPKSQRTES